MCNLILIHCCILSAAFLPAQIASFVPSPRKNLRLGNQNMPVLRKITHAKSRSSTRAFSIDESGSICYEQVDQDTQKYSFWHVWKTAESLEANGLNASDDAILSTTHHLVAEKIVPILLKWGRKWAGEKEWQGILNKSSLLHEVEESVVALSLLLRYISNMNDDDEEITIVDVCSGKGIFSMLASYVFQNDHRVKHIIMLDKASIKWNHIDIINQNAAEECRPLIETWQCNLHEIDQVVDRLESIQTPVSLIGIHLCKTLGPACIGIVNSLDSSHCPLLVLAPCCLPRAVTHTKRNTVKQSTIEIRQHESKSQREARRVAKEKRNAAMMRKRSKPLESFTRGDQVDILIENTQPQGACWKCGSVGHLKADCPSTQTTGKPPLIKPPVIEIDVSNVLSSSRPFDAYCDLLATSIQRNLVEVVETGLFNNKSEHQRGNWNNGRKSIYIVATK